MPWLIAVLGGFSCGALLYSAVTRCRPCLSVRRRPAALVLATQLFFVLVATNEEIVWRRVVLGELLAAGAVAAMLGSTVGFALMHRSRRRLQLVTGAVFGGLYLSTGSLAASVAAHWAYNALVGSLVDRRRAFRDAAP
ncbi:MAG TPA: CPBP family intramembrane glutamic endopeptidase [Gaiellaceae bacterium]|nr:CPBP family intramembrane glutamic endopeptidase [Gaiellaceae bacterium]